MINRTTIIIHTRERTVVRPLSAASLVRCERCALEVLAIDGESAASLLEVNASAVGQLIEGGRLHATTAQGGALICCNSLANLSTNQDQKD